MSAQRWSLFDMINYMNRSISIHAIDHPMWENSCELTVYQQILTDRDISYVLSSKAFKNMLHPLQIAPNFFYSLVVFLCLQSCFHTVLWIYLYFYSLYVNVNVIYLYSPLQQSISVYQSALQKIMNKENNK